MYNNYRETANILLMKKRIKQKAFINREIFIEDIKKDYEKIKIRLAKVK
jgi:hypothetical protein